MSEKVLAIMKGVGFGMRDVNWPVLWFTTFISESGAALQVMGLEEAGKFIKAYGVYDVHNLEGKPVWVEVGDGVIKLVGPANI